ncbi:MAG: CsbD family protein [Vicinamibacterales bacterium]
MKQSTTDQIAGKLREIKGAAKEVAGKVTDNPKLTAEGQAEKLGGQVQSKVGQIKKVFEG